MGYKNIGSIHKNINIQGEYIDKAEESDTIGNILLDPTNVNQWERFENRVKKLIIVTGKGLHSKNDKDPYVSKDLGILKYSIPDYLSKNSELMKMISNISEASIKDGGSGAFYIFLKKK